VAASRHLHRFYHLGWTLGVLLCLPVWTGTGWYGWSAWAQLDRYRRAADEAVPIDLELFQIALHDELMRDLRRAGLPARPAASRLPLYDISLTRESLDALDGQISGGGPREYVPALVRNDGEVRQVGIRYRGGQPWHLLGEQKSMKLRVQGGELLDGTAVFNLLNDPTPFGLEDQIILDLAREMGLLTPEYHPAWVRINNTDMGAYRYEAQPVEDLLRRGRRLPGSLYSGDTERIDPALQAGGLFLSRDGWQKVASASPAAKDDFSELDRLLQAIRADSFREFAEFAQDEISLEKYALFDALDVVFGGSDHDYFSNHKLYFDPASGKCEPVAWSFRGFQHEPAFNLVDNPLLIRLKQVPGYLSLRDRLVYDLLTGKAGVPEIRSRADRMYGELLPELAADPYWDAYKLLPRVTRFHRFMPRPMSAGKALLAYQSELQGFARRSRFLLGALERPGIRVSWTPDKRGGGLIDVTVDGHGAYRFESIAVAAPCAGPFVLHADRDRDGRLSAADPEVARGFTGASAALRSNAEILPGTILVPHPDPDAKHGRVRIEPDPRRYGYLLETPGCEPSRVSLEVSDRVTGESSRLTPSRAAPAAADELPEVDSVPRLEPGQRSPHLWDFPPNPERSEIRLGPGEVRFDVSARFAEQESVVIEPGTSLLLGPAVTLVFRGPVHAAGTSARPIDILRADASRAFGGLALQGAGCAGSRLTGIRIDGGSRARYGPVDYPGLLNIHDTSDVLLEGIDLIRDADSDDVLHAAYVRGLQMHEVSVRGAPTDAVDLEFTTAEIRGLTVVGAGDDCLDLMGTTLRISDSALSGCRNNAISAGEETDLAAQGVLLADSPTGILAKDDSRVRISRSLIYRAGRALLARGAERHYSRGSSIGAEELFAIACTDLADERPGARIETGPVQTVFPADDSLDRLRRFLGLADWRSLDRSLSRTDGSAGS